MVPQVSEASKLGMLLARLEQEFGLTPSARTRIECSEEDEDESIQDYLERRRDEEEFFGKPVQGHSAEEILELLRAKGPPGLQIDRREPELPGQPPKQDSFQDFLRRANESS